MFQCIIGILSYWKVSYLCHVLNTGVGQLKSRSEMQNSLCLYRKIDSEKLIYFLKLFSVKLQ